jgi:glycosyl transferase family 87
VRTSDAGSRPASAPLPGIVSRPRPGRLAWVIAVLTLAALGLRLYQLFRPGYLFGITEYDDGTDFGSAVRFVSGSLPYRDFIMVQPPGITWLMAPVALIAKATGTAAGMAAARILTAVAGAAAIPVAGLLTRHRGMLAVLVTCGLLTVFPDSVMAARTVLLEPWLVLFCLLGALAAFDRDRLAGWPRLLAGGCLLGFAGAVKVWAILPVIVVLVLAARRPRHAAIFAGGVAAGFLVPVLPFAALAPTTFYRSVIVAQLIRSDIARVPFGFRLQHMLGLSHLIELATPALVLLGVLLAVGIAAMVVRAWRQFRLSPPPLEWFALGTCALVVVSFLWPSDFYPHYAAFLAPFLGMAIGLPAARLVDAVAAREARPAPEQAAQHQAAQHQAAQHQTVRQQAVGQQAAPERAAPERAAWWRRRPRAQRNAVAVAAVIVTAFTAVQVGAESSYVAAVPASEIHQAARIVPPGSCVITDQVSYTIAINRFVSSVPGCSQMVDGVGTDYSLSGGRNGLTGAGQAPAVENVWIKAFRAAQFVWLTGQANRRIPWTPQLRAYLDAHFTPLTHGPDYLYTRKR